MRQGSTNAQSDVPAVTVGMPIFNGAKSLDSALQSIIDQTFADIEIVISDNGSSDNTAEICRTFATLDPRIRYIRQPITISSTDNFNFVLGQARAPFFMWAAHDDTRDPDFIQRLHDALVADHGAILAFGDTIEITDGHPRPIDLDFVNRGLTPHQRLHKAAMSQLHHLYGLWRTDSLRRVRWEHVDWWHDTPLMMAASVLGDFIHVPGTCFYYQYNPRPFFFRKRPPGARSFSDHAEFGRHALQIFLMIWIAARTVRHVGGLYLATLAFLYGTKKITFQAVGYLGRRLGVLLSGLKDAQLR